MITHTRFMAGGNTLTFSAGGTLLSLGLGRVKVLKPQNPALRAILPDARNLPLTPGGPIFYLINQGLNVLNIFDNVDVAPGSNLHSIAPGAGCIALLLDNSTQAGVWEFICFPMNAGTTITGTTTATTATTTATTTTTSNTGTGTTATTNSTAGTPSPSTTVTNNKTFTPPSECYWSQRERRNDSKYPLHDLEEGL